jgi:hypothetical protein
MGKSHEDLGNLAGARQYCDLAFDKLDDVPAGPYRDMIARAIEAGRTGGGG